MKESKTGMSRDSDEDSDSPPDELVRIVEEPKEKWDCESILSEYLCVIFNYYKKLHYKTWQSLDFVSLTLGIKIVYKCRFKIRRTEMWYFN